MARQPFYGRGPGPQIARMDMNAATAPGRLYGQMFANLGKIAGDSIEKYAEGKKKKEEQKQTASFIKRALINSPEIAAQFGIQGDDSMTFEEAVDQGSNAIAKDPKGFEMVKGFAAMAAQQRKAQQDTELFNRKIDQFDRSQDTADELKQAKGDFLGKFYSSVPTGEMNEAGQEEVANFQAFAAPEDPRTNPFIQETLQNPEFQQTEPVMDMTGNRFAQQFAGDSPEVQQLALNFMQARQKDAPKPMTPLQVQEYNINAAKELREQTDFNERNQNPSENLSVGQETIDREFAKDLVDFNPADINKGLTQLQEASARLGGTAKDEDGKVIEPENLTGAMIGLMPDAFNDIFNPQASEVKEAVEEVVQRNLRLVLGAAFSQKEGERLINRAYNIRLSEKENKKRVDRLIKSIDGAMQQKQDQARYFNEKGTLKGYQFAPVSIESIERDAFDGSTLQPSANTIDPTDLENAIQAKRKQLEQRTMMQQTLDNPNVPNYGSQ